VQDGSAARASALRWKPKAPVRYRKYRYRHFDHRRRPFALAGFARCAPSTQQRKPVGLFAGAHVRTFDFAVWPKPDSVVERSFLKFDLINIGAAWPDSLEVRRVQSLQAGDRWRVALARPELRRS
jgi:hypothetical protein